MPTTANRHSTHTLTHFSNIRRVRWLRYSALLHHLKFDKSNFNFLRSSICCFQLEEARCCTNFDFWFQLKVLNWFCSRFVLVLRRERKRENGIVFFKQDSNGRTWLIGLTLMSSNCYQGLQNKSFSLLLYSVIFFKNWRLACISLDIDIRMQFNW